MKKPFFLIIIVFCVLNSLYGYERYPPTSASNIFSNTSKRDFQPTEFNPQPEDFNFWTNVNSFWSMDLLTESCSITDRYGSCSASCDKGKAVCKAGHTEVLETNIYGSPKRTKDYPPECYCQ